MKIAGRVIQNRNIKLNSASNFKADYKKHSITVDLVKLGHTNTYYIYVRKLNTISIPDKVDENVNRCTIREAIIFALNRAGL